MLRGESQAPLRRPRSQLRGYEITPYVFNPKMAVKVTGKEHLDMGQGLLNIMAGLHQKYVLPHQEENVVR